MNTWMKTLKIIMKWETISQYKNIFQCVYWDIFPEIYSSTERQGFDLKSSFHVMFETHKDKKNGNAR